MHVKMKMMSVECQYLWKGRQLLAEMLRWEEEEEVCFEYCACLQYEVQLLVALVDLPVGLGNWVKMDW